MALLNITNQKPVYKDSRAGILMGSGNPNISDQVIKNFINKPGRTGEQTLKEALRYGVSADQLARNSNYTIDQIKNYASKSGGILFDTEKTELPQYEIPQAKATKAVFRPAVQDPVKGTVAGQLDTILSNPESPLLRRAASFADQKSNRRGLLNSSIGTSAAQAAITDAGLQIATPDAASNNQFNLFNADTDNKTRMFNAGEANKVSMFNTGTTADILRNRENNLTSILNNRENNATSTLNNRESLEANKFIAGLDTDTKLAIANLQSKSEDNKYAMSLYDTLLKLQESYNTNPDMTPDDKARYFSDAVKLMENGLSLLDTFDKVDLGDFNFTPSSQEGTSSGSISTGETSSSRNRLFSGIKNVAGQEVETSSVDFIEKWNKANGTSYKPNQLLSQREVEQLESAPNMSELQRKYGIQPVYGRAKDGLTSYRGMYVYV